MYNIYCIKSKITNFIYIGITKLSIEERFKRHIKHSYDKKHNGRLYQEMRKTSRKNYFIDLIEITDDINRETYWINFYLSNPNYIVLNEVNGPFKITKEELYKAYIIEKKSSRQIAKQFGLKSKTSILNLLKAYNIQERHSRKLCLDEQKIYSEFKNGKSQRKLALEYNVDRSVINRIVKQNSPSNS